MQKIIFLFCLFILSSCASTDLNGVVDPDYRRNFKIKKILIASMGLSLKEKQIFENTMERYLDSFDVKISKELDLFPPTRFTSLDVDKKLKQENIDAIFYLVAGNQEVTSSYIPKQYYSSGYADETSAGYSSYTTGGYYIYRPQMNIKAVLLDVKKTKLVWVGEGFSSGSAISSFSDLIKNIAKTSAKKLVGEGFFSPK